MPRDRDAYRDASRCFRFNTAVVSRVASSFGESSSFDDGSAAGADAGVQPHVSECRQELERLVDVLRGDLGLDVVELPSDEHQPDGVFVSDIAVVIGGVALICNPPRFNNRPSRHGEVCPGPAVLVCMYICNIYLIVFFVANKCESTLYAYGVQFTGQSYIGLNCNVTERAIVSQLNKYFVVNK